MEQREFHTTTDFGRKVGRSKDTICRLVRDGKLKPAAVVGKGGRREYLFTEKEINQFLLASAK